MYENFPKVNHNPWIEYFMEETTRRMIVQVYEQCERYDFDFDLYRSSSLKSLIIFTVNLSRCIYFISKSLVLSPRAEIRSSIRPRNPRNIIIFER